MRKSSTVFVGMDVHKDSIDIAIAELGGEVRHYGRIGGDAASLDRAVRKLRSVQRALVEAAQAYAHPARVSWIIARRQSALPQALTDIAWAAQLRLCARFRRLAARGLNRNKIVVAVARELCLGDRTRGETRGLSLAHPYPSAKENPYRETPADAR